MVLVSVVTATYNGQRFVEQTIRSVLGQREVDLDYVVVDDCSIDRTRKIISGFASPQSPDFDPRVSVSYHPENMGILPTYKEGLKRSRGEYIKFVDHDDLLADPEALAKQARVLDEHPEVDIVICGARVISSEGRPCKFINYPGKEGIVDKETLRRYLLFSPKGPPIVHGNLLSRRQALERFGTFDHELLVDVLVSGGEIYSVNENLFDYRRHRGNASSSIPQRLGVIGTRTRLVEKLATNGLRPFVYPLMIYRAAAEAAKMGLVRAKQFGLD